MFGFPVTTEERRVQDRRRPGHRRFSQECINKTLNELTDEAGRRQGTCCDRPGVDRLTKVPATSTRRPRAGIFFFFPSGSSSAGVACPPPESGPPPGSPACPAPAAAISPTWAGMADPMTLFGAERRPCPSAITTPAGTVRACRHGGGARWAGGDLTPRPGRWRAVGRNHGARAGDGPTPASKTTCMARVGVLPMCDPGPRPPWRPASRAGDRVRLGCTSWCPAPEAWLMCGRRSHPLTRTARGIAAGSCLRHFPSCVVLIKDARGRAPTCSLSPPCRHHPNQSSSSFGRRWTLSLSHRITRRPGRLPHKPLTS